MGYGQLEGEHRWKLQRRKLKGKTVQNVRVHRQDKLAARVIKRQSELKTFTQQQAEIARRWRNLQQTIDWTQIRLARLERSSDDHARASRYALKKVIVAQEREQEKLDAERSINAARSGIRAAAQEEDDLFAAWPWALQNCQEKAGCFVFTKTLQESFQNATDFRELVRAEEARLAEYEVKLSDERGDSSSPVSHPSHVLETADIANIKKSIDRCRRAMQPRIEIRDAYKQELYDILQQALMQSRQDLPPPRRTHSIAKRPTLASHGSPNAVPPLTEKMVSAYRGGNAIINNVRVAHDRFRLNSAKELVEAFRKDPTMTRTDFDRQRVRDRRKAIQELRSVQEKFVRRRDEALTAGAQPLALAEYVQSDVPAFGGSHPSDGWTGSSCCTGMRQLGEKYITFIATPKASEWMRGWESFPNEDRETCGGVPRCRGWKGCDNKELAKLRREPDMPEEWRNVVQP